MNTRTRVLALTVVASMIGGWIPSGGFAQEDPNANEPTGLRLLSDPDIFGAYLPLLTKLDLEYQKVYHHPIPMLAKGFLVSTSQYLNNGGLTAIQIVDDLFKGPKQSIPEAVFVVRFALKDLENSDKFPAYFRKMLAVDEAINRRMNEYNRNVELIRWGSGVGGFAVGLMVGKFVAKAVPTIQITETVEQAAQKMPLPRLVPGWVRTASQILIVNSKKAAAFMLGALQNTIKFGSAGAGGITMLIGANLKTEKIGEVDPIVDYRREQ